MNIAVLRFLRPLCVSDLRPTRGRGLISPGEKGIVNHDCSPLGPGCGEHGSGSNIGPVDN